MLKSVLSYEFKNESMMDVYYQQLAKTLDWSKERGVDVAVPESELKIWALRALNILLMPFFTLIHSDKT